MVKCVLPELAVFFFVLQEDEADELTQMVRELEDVVILHIHSHIVALRIVEIYIYLRPVRVVEKNLAAVILTPKISWHPLLIDEQVNPTSLHS
jgi:hypothetical protein